VWLRVTHPLSWPLPRGAGVGNAFGQGVVMGLRFAPQLCPCQAGEAAGLGGKVITR
jgi:hypothetical protein